MDVLSDWLQNLQQNHFNGTDNVRINYAVMKQTGPSPAMIICNGRIESYLKYRELACDFFAQGYSVYLLDHRGQGLSERMTSDRQQGHVSSFEDYSLDLRQLVHQVVADNGHSQHILLGHSMGGAIATRYIESGNHLINKLIVASPMFGIILPMPVWMIQRLVKSVQYVKEFLSSQPSFILGGQSYLAPSFDKNVLTQSKERYTEFRAVYLQYPDIQMGAPTNQWLLEAITSAQDCIDHAPSIDIPTLLLQAGADTIVKSEAQRAFAAQLDEELIKFVNIADARHELLFELDRYRDQAMTEISQFID